MKMIIATIILLFSASMAFSETIIVDNVTSAPHAFTTDGGWSTDTSITGYYGANYVLADGLSSASARWRPSVTTSGVYKIYMKWTANAARADRVPVEITYDNGTKTDSTRRLNQKINGGTWVYIGAYFLRAGTNNTVRIEAGADEGSVCADAVLFELSYATTTSPSEPALTTPRAEYTNAFSQIERPDAAPLTVYYNGGGSSSIVNLNQTTNGSQWNLVGTYYLTSGTGNSLKLNATDSGIVAADAVKFELASDTNVSVIVDNITSAPHAFTSSGSWPAATSPAGFYGENYLYNTGSQSSSAVRWRPSLDTAGTYNVYIRWPNSRYDTPVPEEVLIVRTDSGESGTDPVFELRIDGAPFYVKGSCGTEAIEEIAAAGGNTVRAYSVQSMTPDIMNRCDAAGIKVILGLWLTQADGVNATFYDNPVNVSNQFETLKIDINEYKDYKSLLTWVIGNEFDDSNVVNREPVYKALQQVARYIREVDHYHPSQTGTATSNTNKLMGVVQWAPDVDIIGVNSYDPHIFNVYSNMLTAGWNGPYLSTEYFLRQPMSMIHAEHGETSWGAIIEPVSADKYTRLLELYADPILAHADRCLGSFVFKGSQGGFRVTHTWYPILDENLKPTPSYDAMRINWGGPAAPELTAPQVETIKINDLYAWENVIITNATGLLTATVTVTAPTNAILEYLVEIRTNVSTSVNYSPPPLTGITITQDSVTPSTFYIKNEDMPNGDYRLFYYVRRIDGAAPGDYVSVGTANIPFRKLTTTTYSVGISPNNSSWGSVSPTGGTYLASSTIQIRATANPYYRFSQWAGDFTGTVTPVYIKVTSDMNIQAVFAENLLTNNTPAWWLAQHGLGVNDSAALADNDSDGLTNWQEYIAGTNPTNQASTLQLSNFSGLPSGNAIQWQSVSGRVYTVYWTSNLLSGFQTLETNIPWTGNIFTDSVHNASDQGFYKIDVQRTP